MNEASLYTRIMSHFSACVSLITTGPRYSVDGWTNKLGNATGLRRRGDARKLLLF